MPRRASAIRRGRACPHAPQALDRGGAPMQRCVLLVDDEPRNLLALEALLQPLGHRLVRAPDAVAAMQVFEEVCPDLVVSDLMMPRYDGVDLLGMIRAHPQR